MPGAAVGGVTVERHGATLDCGAAWTRYESNGTTTSSGSSSRGRRRGTPSTRAAIAELAEAFVDVGKARAVVLVGEGQSFCAGADIEWMRQSVSLSHDENVADANALRRMLDAIDSCPAPVIAVVQGHALGGGAGLVATADIALAHERAVFGFSEVKLGITPAVISPYVLRKIGESAARRYFVTGERFDAATALRIGLVHEVVTDLDAASGGGSRRASHGRPESGEARQAARARPARRAGDGAADRRAAGERRGPGRAGRVHRATASTVGTASRARRVTALLALISAVFIGGADFVGGITSRTANGIRVGAYVALVGLPMALAVSLVGDYERVSRADVGWSVAAGVSVALGIGCFYIAMARGLISVVAPVAAVVGAVIPVVYAFARGERPGPIALVGLVIAFFAVAVVSLAPSEQHPDAAIVDGVVLGLALRAASCSGCSMSRSRASRTTPGSGR